MAERRTIVLVESAFVIQAGLGKLFEEFSGMTIEKVFDGSEKNLAEKIRSLKPDVVFINSINVNSGISSIIKETSNNDCLVVGLVDESTPPNVSSLFRYHLSVADGKYELLETLKSILGKLPVKEKSNDNSSVLSHREITILKHVVSGSTTQEIADKLFLSVHTVNTHRKNITNKLGIKTVSGLTVYALMNKIVILEEINKK